MAWHQIYDLPTSDPVERKNWTRAIVQNRLFMYRQDDLYILELDTTSVPGEPQIIAHTPQFANMAGVQGIFQARGRLGLWDQENAIYWSDIDDLLDFTPSLETLASVVKVDDVKGKISHVLQAQEGFIIYTTANVVGMFETADNRVFRAIELDDKLGIFSSDHVCIGMGGEHIIWSNGNLYKVNANRDPRRQAVEPLFPAVSDTLKQYEGYPRLYHYNNRYFVVGLAKRDFIPGETVIQRRKVEGNTYFEPQRVFDMSFQTQGWSLRFMQNVNLNKPADYITPASVLSPQACGPRRLYIPEEVPDYPLAYPPGPPKYFDTEGYQPPAECQNTLWGAFLGIQPALKLTGRSVSGSSGCWSPDTGGALAVELDSYSLGYTWWASGVEEEWQGISNPQFQIDWKNKAPSFSFSSYSLIAAQVNEWKKRYQRNNDNAGTLDDSSAMWEGYLCDVIAQDPGPQDTVISGDAVWPASTQYSASSQVVGDPEDEVTQYINVRVVANASGTVQSTYSRTLERSVERYEIGQEPYPDWTVVDSGQDSRPADNNGTAYLVGKESSAMESDTYFQRYFYSESSGLSAQWHDPIRDLGQSYPTEASDLWGTVMNLAGYGDGCSYAKASSHAARRAWNKDFSRQYLAEQKNELKEKDPEDETYGFFYTRYRASWLYPVNLDTLTEEAFNVPAAGGYRGLYGFAPQRELTPVYPVATFTHPQNIDPSPYLGEFYKRAVAEYPGEDISSAIIKVYESEGWTASEAQSPPISIPPSSIPLEDKGNGYLEPETWDRFNEQNQSGFFSELHDNLTLCGREILAEDTVEPPSAEPVAPKTITSPPVDIDNQFGTDGWRIKQPAQVLLEGSSSTGATYPVYNIHLVYDEILKKWGICGVPCEVFISLRPENETAYNPLNTESTSAYTYRDFFSALGGLLPSGLTVVWTDQPDQSYLIVGKAGLEEEGFTQWTELEAEFASEPNGLVGIETSIDGKLVNVYTVKLKQAKEIIEKMYVQESGRYANFLVFGHYHIIQWLYKGQQRGVR